MKINKRPAIAHGKQSEGKAAKRMGAALTVNSGSHGDKGDMTIAGFRIESKSTRVDSLILEREWIEKITHEAAHANEDPALLIQFVNDRGDKRMASGSWIAVPEDVFMELLEGRDE